MKKLNEMLNLLSKNKGKLLFITAMRFESAVIQQQVPFDKKEKYEEILFWRSIHSDIALAQIGMGAYGKERILQYIFETENPDLVINYGIAGAINPALSPGAGYLVTEILDKEFQPVDIKIPQGLNLQKTSLVTSYFPVIKKEIRNNLYQHSKCDLVDMEAAVLARICNELKIPFICLKVVSDFADEQAVATVKKNKELLQSSMLKLLQDSLRQLH